ncbi:hypothetical protein Q5752_003585 [Cryptotrichosporon argae]
MPLSLPRHSKIRHVLARRGFSTLGIRREDPSRVWERRAPLTPDAVHQLISTSQSDVRVEIERCARRCFPDSSYTQAGAKVVDELSRDVDVVIGIKEPRVTDLQRLGADRKRTWLLFSHTHKGQEYNTPLLAAFLDNKQTLVDHELLTAPRDGVLKRVAAFGWFAGAVGAGEALCLTGLGLLKRGTAHPLLHLPRPYTFDSLVDFKAALWAAGRAIANAPPPDQPVAIGLTGAGNVSTGAREMLDELGVTWVQPEELATVQPASKVYACLIPPSFYLDKDGRYSRPDYYASPHLYRSRFIEKVASHITTLINGAGWQSGFPRLLSDEDMRRYANGEQKIVAVQDISCDLKGGLEFVDRHTTIDSPSFEGPGGVLVSSTDILPSELPTDASRHFSDRILPYVVRALEAQQAQDEVADTLARATITENGRLLGPHRSLETKLEALRCSKRESMSGAKKKVLLLGSGLVAGPAVEVFTGRRDVALTIASNNALEAQTLSRDRATVVALDVSDCAALSSAVGAHDVIVSLLPAPMHVGVAEQCVKHGKHLVTASYISPEMKALHESAEKANVVLLGECGLDPGIDSMAAMRILDRAQREGRAVKSFVSWCGGLPQPTASNLPLGYKFSWSPKAVLTAALNDARFKLRGDEYRVDGSALLRSHFPEVDLWRGLKLEGLANRDSLPYAEKYGLGALAGLRNVFRGTLRYPGFAVLLDAIRQLGLLSSEPLHKQPSTWTDLTTLCASRQEGQVIDAQEAEVYARLVVARAGGGEHEIEALRWLSILPSDRPSPPIPRSGAPIDLLASLFSHKLAYVPGEPDLCLLHHAFTFTHPSSAKEETVTASLAVRGTAQVSAMSTTVGATLALAALRVLDGGVRARGVVGPYKRDVWGWVLDALEERGVRVEETWGAPPMEAPLHLPRTV